MAKQKTTLAAIVGPASEEDRLQSWRRAAVVVGVFTPDHDKLGSEDGRFFWYNLNTRRATPSSTRKVLEDFYTLVVEKVKTALPSMDPAQRVDIFEILKDIQGNVITCHQCGQETSAETGQCSRCGKRLLRRMKPTYRFDKKDAKKLLKEQIISVEDVLRLWKDEPTPAWDQSAWVNNELARHPKELFRTDQEPLKIDPDEIGFPKEGYAKAVKGGWDPYSFVETVIKPKIWPHIAAGEYDDWLAGGTVRKDHRNHWMKVLGLAPRKRKSEVDLRTLVAQAGPLAQITFITDEQYRQHQTAAAEQLIDESAEALAEVLKTMEPEAEPVIDTKIVEEPELAMAASTDEMSGLKKFSAQETFDNLQTVEEIIDYLIHNTQMSTTADCAHDHLLVDKFFPLIGSRFHTESDVGEDDVEFFKETFDYETYLGGKADEAKEKIKDMRSVGRIIDTIIGMMSQKKLEELAKEHLRVQWFERNFDSNLEKFKEGLNRKYWYL